MERRLCQCIFVVVIIVYAASLMSVTVVEAANTSITVRLLSSYRVTMNCKTF